jgi:general secretion pathway protein F
MARFHFRAVAGSGEVVEGDLDAATEAEVVATLRGQGRLPLRVEPAALGSSGRARSPAGQWLHQPLFRRRRVRRHDVALMTRELSTLLDAGLTLDHSLRLMIDLVEGEALPELLRDLLQQVQGGSTLADALARHESVFSQTYISMVRAGEAGGSLDEVLARLASYLDQAEALGEQVKSALIYPIVVLAIAGLSIAVLLTVVLPQFTPLFEGAGAELPLLTRVLIGLGAFMQRYWWALALGILVAAWLVRRQWRRPASRARIDGWLLRLPLVGPLVAKVDTARFARTLGALLANGVPMLNALAIVQDAIGNASLRQAVADASTGVKEGRGLAEPLGQSNLFPALVLHLLSVGERSGRLEPMLMKIADVFDREVRSTIERLMTLLVPALTITLGLIIALIIGAILMAILSTYDLAL